MNAAEHARIFGSREARTPGRTRMCKVCGDWHRTDKPWPHNCREPAPPRAKLATPMLAPKFTDFVAGTVHEPVMISDPRAKREHMARHDLVEWDDGIKPEPEPTDRQWEAQFMSDLKRTMEEDPLNRPPVEVIGRTKLDGADEIDTSSMETFE